MLSRIASASERRSSALRRSMPSSCRVGDMVRSSPNWLTAWMIPRNALRCAYSCSKRKERALGT
jgi:hypothetical protein